MNRRRKVPKECTDRIRRVDLAARLKGVPDSDRYELLRYANILDMYDSEILHACNSNPEGDIALVDFRRSRT